jgi:porin
VIRAIVTLSCLALPLPSASGQELSTGGETPAIRYQIVYTGDVFTLGAGGLDGGTDYLADVSVAITLDAEKLIGWKGAHLFFYGLGNYGRDPSERVGDLQGVSNIAAPRDVQIYEAWVEQNVARHLSVLVGLYDINSEFDVLESAGLLLNSSFGIGPELSLSSVAGPSIFPFTTIGARISAQPLSSLFLKAAVMDGDAGDIGLSAEDGALLVGEAAVLIGGPAAAPLLRRRMGRGRRPASYRTKLALGGWHYTRDFPLIGSDTGAGPVVRGGNTGVYGLLEHLLMIDPVHPQREITGFLQLGWSHPDVNTVTAYMGAGIVYDGVFRGRRADRLGVGVAAAFLGGRAREALAAAGGAADRYEVTLEVTYRANVVSHFTVQPDVQYVLSPGANPEVANALVFGLRFELEL